MNKSKEAALEILKEYSDKLDKSLSKHRISKSPDTVKSLKSPLLMDSLNQPSYFNNLSSSQVSLTNAVAAAWKRRQSEQRIPLYERRESNNQQFNMS